MTVENKIYLLIDNLGYYPSAGSTDWIGLYVTEALARAAMLGQREARLADNLTIVAIDLEDLTWREVAHDNAV